MLRMFFNGYDWVDLSKYDLVLKDEYRQEEVSRLERYKKYLEKKILDLDDEIKELGGTK